MVDSPNDALQTHKVSGRNSPMGGVGGQKTLKNPQNLENLSPDKEGGGTGVGDHFGTFPPISVSIDGTSPKLLWWIALSETLQIYKFPGQKSPRGRISGQKSLENTEKVMKS